MDSDALTALLDYLDATQPSEPQEVGNWRVRRVTGGANNLVYHAKSSADEVAVKFCIADARDRAGREFGALAALQAADLTLAQGLYCSSGAVTPAPSSYRNGSAVLSALPRPAMMPLGSGW